MTFIIMIIITMIIIILIIITSIQFLLPLLVAGIANAAIYCKLNKEYVTVFHQRSFLHQCAFARSHPNQRPFFSLQCWRKRITCSKVLYEAPRPNVQLALRIRGGSHLLTSPWGLLASLALAIAAKEAVLSIAEDRGRTSAANAILLR